MSEKIMKVPFQARLHPANHAWLKAQAVEQERSANWILDKMLSEARLADATERERQNVQH